VAGRESLRGAPAACACPLRPRTPFALARPLPRRCTSSTHSGTPYDSGRPLTGTPFDGSETCNGSLWSGIWRRHFARAGLRAELASRWAASRLAASRATPVERTPRSSPCRAECRCKQGSGASLDVSPDDALYASTGECLGIERTECLQITKRKPPRDQILAEAEPMIDTVQTLRAVEMHGSLVRQNACRWLDDGSLRRRRLRSAGCNCMERAGASLGVERQDVCSARALRERGAASAHLAKDEVARRCRAARW